MDIPVIQSSPAPEAFRVPDAEGRDYLPSAYQSVALAARGPVAATAPTNVFIEVTNHCNLLCGTCPRTFTSYEAPMTLTWERFEIIVEQFPKMERAILHGIGEPLLNKNLPRMIAHLKTRGVTVLFNTNATLLTEDWSRWLIEAGLDELRVSVDGADPKTYALIRGAPLFHKVVANLRRFVQVQQSVGAERPRPSLWMTGMNENIAELPDVIRLAARIGVPEVYLQRMVYRADDAAAPGLTGNGHGLFAEINSKIDRLLAESEVLAGELGVTLRASGATTPQHSRRKQADPRPWAACMRPWTTAYITANGNALPCCIAPFATTDYDSLILGNLLEQPFGDLWNGDRYQQWREQLLSDHPHAACAGCGVHWSL